jgi:hypothetical protein
MPACGPVVAARLHREPRSRAVDGPARPDATDRSHLRNRKDARTFARHAGLELRQERRGIRSASPPFRRKMHVASKRPTARESPRHRPLRRDSCVLLAPIILRSRNLPRRRVPSRAERRQKPKAPPDDVPFGWAGPYLALWTSLMPSPKRDANFGSGLGANWAARVGGCGLGLAVHEFGRTAQISSVWGGPVQAKT